MDVIFLLVLIFFGLAILIKGADFLVSGASSIASIFKINPMVIGLTIVAFGTSAPELTVSVASAMAGNTDLALGNVIGSNIANILLILGLSAMFCTLTVHKNTVWKEIPMSFLGALVLTVLGLQDLIDRGHILKLPFSGAEIIGSVTPSNGIILLFFFVIFLYYTFGIAKINADVESEVDKKPLNISIVYVVIGLVALVLGSKLFVDNGAQLARIIGASDALIGLTLFALGTSLPELVTSVVAALKKKVDIAVGNVIGSNIFNIFFVLGITSVVKTIPLSASIAFDILVLFGATILLFISLFVLKRHTLSRVEGSLMLLVYAVYILAIINRG